MKAYSPLLPLIGAALLMGFTSCSSNSGGYADAETAEAVASGTMPPWMAEYSESSYETGSYSSESSNYAYNPPPKPTVSSSSSSKSKPKASSSSKKKPTPSTRTYTVKRGDTLGALARRYGTSVTAIKRANGLKSDLIRIDQRLKIPRGK